MDWSLSLSAEPQAIGEARRHLRGALSGCGIDEQHMQDALLVTSELVTNAVRHGSCQGDRVDLEIQLVDHRLSLCVRDAGRLQAKAGISATASPYRRSPRPMLRNDP